MDKKKIILDCDPGMDDSMAIVMACKSEALDVLAVTTVNGNYPAEVTCVNALKVLEMIGRTDVPVGKGMVIYVNVANSTGDSARMAAQVISGIGFLGAGTIMTTGNDRVKGLTTAAALWVTAAIGIAIGTGFYFGGIAGLIVLYLSSFTYRYIDAVIVARSRIMRIYVEGESEEFMLNLVGFFQKNEIRIISLVRKDENKWFLKDSAATIEMDLGRKRSHFEILDEIRRMKELRYIEEV